MRKFLDKLESKGVHYEVRRGQGYYEIVVGNGRKYYFSAYTKNPLRNVM